MDDRVVQQDSTADKIDRATDKRGAGDAAMLQLDSLTPGQHLDKYRPNWTDNGEPVSPSSRYGYGGRSPKPRPKPPACPDWYPSNFGKEKSPKTSTRGRASPKARHLRSPGGSSRGKKSSPATSSIASPSHLAVDIHDDEEFGTDEEDEPITPDAYRKQLSREIKDKKPSLRNPENRKYSSNPFLAQLSDQQIWDYSHLSTEVEYQIGHEDYADPKNWKANQQQSARINFHKKEHLQSPSGKITNILANSPGVSPTGRFRYGKIQAMGGLRARAGLEVQIFVYRFFSGGNCD